MAELTGFLVMPYGRQLMLNPNQWNVPHNRNGSK
jgi:hypothetical protein